MVSERELGVSLAKQTGEIIRKNFTLGMRKEWKSDNTPLTETDLSINQLVIESIKKEFPAHSVLAEEGSNFSHGDEYVWVCDPIDGTIPFSHGMPTCVFSLALVQNGEPILGVIYDPFMDRMFVAEKGKGAFLNGKRTEVSKATSVKSQMIGVAVWKHSAYDITGVSSKLDDQLAFVTNCWSVTYMGSLIATGEFAATIFAGKKPWDTAALKIIIEEAGGKVTDIFGNEQRYDQEIKGHLATNGVLHDELLTLIKQSMK